MMVMDICFSPNAAHTYDWKYFVHRSHTGMNFVEVFSEDNRTISISSSSRIGVEGSYLTSLWRKVYTLKFRDAH